MTGDAQSVKAEVEGVSLTRPRSALATRPSRSDRGLVVVPWGSARRHFYFADWATFQLCRHISSSPRDFGYPLHNVDGCQL